MPKSSRSKIHSLSKPFQGYRTRKGRYWIASIEDWLESRYARELNGNVNLIVTSPPFPLSRKKSYGNLNGSAYLDWLRRLAPKLRQLLADDGSLVIEIGNAWNPGEPTMSTLPMEALLAVRDSGDLNLCQEFICHNPARLPSPVQYVNVERSRIKDSWTRVWWLSPSKHPKADNRNILVPYSKAMRDLLKRQSYNAGHRPSEHVIGEKSFLRDNGGAIPASCLLQETLDHFGSVVVAGNTKSGGDPYLEYCRRKGIKAHPARMQEALARFFVSFLTDPDDLVLDPFGGSNTTGRIAEDLRRRWAVVEINHNNLIPSKQRFVTSRKRRR
ncbi:site-specific DNA-methyltransferase [Planctomycetales bacterium ZRK34]|nr:site-specific DNA-methyltransferase [Planctomycetales bacterium ZRK34]